MSDLITHIHQAQHNGQCTEFLLKNEPQYRDWAITAAFYAAVHLAEACFTTRAEIGHTESAPSRHRMEKHKFRAEQINLLAPGAYASYRKLQNASNTARYLVTRKSTLATEFFSENDAWELFRKDLETVRIELEKAFGVSLS